MSKKRLFIIGAPKCGTTSLAKWLSEHPDIYMSDIKEPHYYSTDLNNRTIENKHAYESLFADAPEKTSILAEASTWYLYSAVAVRNILADYPDAIFIVMSRDPVQMAISLFYHNRFKGYEDTESMAEAWALQQKRAQGEEIPPSCIEPAFLLYGAACALGSLIRRLLEQVDRTRVLHVRLESLQKNTAAEYVRILNFLELPDEGRMDFPKYNEAKTFRLKCLVEPLKLGSRWKRMLGVKHPLGIRRLNMAKLSHKPVDAELIRKLEQYFDSEKAWLSSL